MLYADDPAFYHRRWERMARTTPAEIRAAMQRWLRRPVFALRVDPGDREPYQEAPAVVAAHAQSLPAPVAEPHVPRTMPPVGAFTPLDLPAVERARLSNGIQIVYARRAGLPMTRIAVSFDAGSAAEPSDRNGLQGMMLSLQMQGTTSLNSTQLAEAQERLGAQIGVNAGQDRTTVSLTALTTNLDPSLDLLADVIRRPAFAPAEVERIRQQRLAAISSELTTPQGLAARVLPGLLFGPGYPYGRPGGSGIAAAVRGFTREALVAFHQAWIRPDNATIFAVGDLPLTDLTARLERRLGDWRAPDVPRGVKHFDVAIPAARPRIVLIDRPQSPQSLILAAQAVDAEGTQDLLELDAANDVLAGDFLARVNMDIRERRGWSYGARGGLSGGEHRLSYVIQAPVQADRTGESIQAIMEDVRRFLAANGTQSDELRRVIDSNTRQLPGQFQTGSALLGAMITNALHRRPDNYYETIAGRYQALSASTLDGAARRYLDPARFVWVVVGDAARVRPQLERLGLPIEELPLSH
jgi:predicted Zn-dependent peptidase